MHKGRMTTQFKPLERVIQSQLMRWFSYEHSALSHLFFAIPNGGSRHLLEAVNLKRQGVKRGVLDIFLAVPSKGYHGLFLETKREGGRLTEAQQKFSEAVIEKGYLAFTYYSLDEGIEKINNYLN